MWTFLITLNNSIHSYIFLRNIFTCFMNVPTVTHGCESYRHMMTVHYDVNNTDYLFIKGPIIEWLTIGFVLTFYLKT